MKEKRSSLKNKETVNFIDFTKIQNCPDTQRAKLLNQLSKAGNKIQSDLNRISKEFNIPLDKTKKFSR